jgi:hypothetical protein
MLDKMLKNALNDMGLPDDEVARSLQELNTTAKIILQILI